MNLEATIQKFTVKHLVITALCIATGIALPQGFHIIAGNTAGQVLLPMHIPVLICGLVCGWRYGTLCGIILPFISSMITGMPPIFPIAVYMAFELAAYGFVSGYVYKKHNVFVALIGAMISGRVVLAIVQFILFGIFGVNGQTFQLAAFFTSAFVTAVPGILLQIVLIPVLMKVLEKVGYKKESYL